MKLKVFHLNIEGGRQMDSIIPYLKRQSYDIIHLQEVSGGKMSNAGAGNFQTVKDELHYEGELAIAMRYENQPDSYSGNATFYDQEKLQVIKKEITWLKDYKEIPFLGNEKNPDEEIKKFPRNILSLLFTGENKQFWSINTHLTWGPTHHDEPYKVEQGKILYKSVAAKTEPFILTGDFNVDRNSEIVQAIDTVAVNHSVKANVTNTLNPRWHKAPHLFPPGLAVDFIYTSPQVSYADFKVVDEPDLSDHLGLEITVEI